MRNKNSRTNYDMVHEMNIPELAAWIAIQIKEYYKADNTIIFEDEIKRITHIYVDWLMEEEKE